MARSDLGTAGEQGFGFGLALVKHLVDGLHETIRIFSKLGEGITFEISLPQSLEDAIKYIKNLGKIIRICLGNGWLIVDPYLNYKPKQKTVHCEVLTKEELERLTKKKFSVERLSTVRDMFVFCCYTWFGLRGCA